MPGDEYEGDEPAPVYRDGPKMEIGLYYAGLNAMRDGLKAAEARAQVLRDIERKVSESERGSSGPPGRVVPPPAGVLDGISLTAAEIGQLVSRALTTVRDYKKAIHAYHPEGKEIP